MSSDPAIANVRPWRREVTLYLEDSLSGVPRKAGHNFTGHVMLRVAEASGKSGLLTAKASRA
jgi:hypothetical protein